MFLMSHPLTPFKSRRRGKFVASYTSFRVKELNEKAAANIIITLVGNKIDLENRQVSKEEGESYARSLGLQYHEVSAKANIGIESLFRGIAKLLPSDVQIKKKGATLTGKEKEA